MKFILVFICALFCVSTSYARGFDDGPLADGTYDAQVTTRSGTYSVPVEVESGEVTEVHWPNGGDMTVDGADIDSLGSASGSNSRGDFVDIEIDN